MVWGFVCVEVLQTHAHLNRQPVNQSACRFCSGVLPIAVPSWFDAFLFYRTYQERSSAKVEQPLGVRAPAVLRESHRVSLQPSYPGQTLRFLMLALNPNPSILVCFGRARVFIDTAWISLASDSVSGAHMSALAEHESVRCG